MSVLNQALCTFIVCWIRMSFCITFSWPAFTTAVFKSENTPLHRPMTDFEAALFGSISSIGALISTPVLGLLLDVLGRRKSMILASVTHVLTWAIIVLTNRVEALLAGMFIAGAGISSFLVIPVYITEVCQASVRGTMTSGMMLAFGVGMLVSYLLGGYVRYTIMCYVCLGVAVLGAVMTLVLKESPVFLMKKGREEEAVQSMAYYRNTTGDSKIVMQEIDNIRKSLGGAEVVPTEEQEKLEKPAKNVSFCQFIKSSRSTRKAAILVMMLLTLSMFHGYVVVCVYAGNLFQEAVPTLSPVLCSPLMLYSSLASGVCCVVLGSQIQLHWAPPVVTVVAIFAFCFIYILGAGAVPYVVAAEVFLPEVSSVLSMVSYELTWICTFIVLFAFAPLVSLLGLGGVFYLFAIVCFSTVGYTAYFLPETNGLTVDAIQKLF